jgi:hypothetical protein
VTKIRPVSERYDLVAIFIGLIVVADVIYVVGALWWILSP